MTHFEQHRAHGSAAVRWRAILPALPAILLLIWPLLRSLF
jgi:hypothetical protein